MHPLEQLYERYIGPVEDPRRVRSGTSLFLGGTLLVVLGILSATSPLLTALGYSIYGAREIGGTLAGIGTPALFIGLTAMLRTDEKYRRFAYAGAAICVLGVGVFRLAYPHHWAGYGMDLTPYVTTLYFIGVFVTAVYMFVGIVNSEIKIEEIRMFSEPEPEPEPAPEPESEPRPSPTDTSQSGGAGIKANVESIEDPEQDDGVVLENESPPPETVVDKYCGNCEHFDYVDTAGGMKPYCALYDEIMDDVEPCDDWEPKRDQYGNARPATSDD